MGDLSFLRRSMIESYMLNDSEDLLKIFRDWKIDLNNLKYAYTLNECELHYILKTKSVNVLYEYCNLLNVSWERNIMYPNYADGEERFINIHIKDGEAVLFIPKETDEMLHTRQIRELIGMQTAIDMLREEDDFSETFSEDCWLEIISNIEVDKQSAVTFVHKFVDSSIYDEFTKKLREFPMYADKKPSFAISTTCDTIIISTTEQLWIVAIIMKYIKSIYARFGLEVKQFNLGYSKDKSSRTVKLIF